MFIATRIRIAQSPIGAACSVKKDVAGASDTDRLYSINISPVSGGQVAE